MDLKNIHSLSRFQRHTREHLARLKETGEPEVLTVHGQAEVVIQSVESYQRLLDLARNAAAIVGVQRGLMGMYAGTGEDAENAFVSLEEELGISPDTP
ncbi:MAG: type II toxin-antitoxin system Phd/YefM family antitoxin [Gemmatimonadales bacterium]|nr:MAG: type II toxin-antitoxin system Phd/YefM family antitoxin [Gemmatimonadales bacterium]